MWYHLSLPKTYSEGLNSSERVSEAGINHVKKQPQLPTTSVVKPEQDITFNEKLTSYLCKINPTVDINDRDYIPDTKLSTLEKCQGYERRLTSWKTQLSARISGGAEGNLCG